MRIVSTAAALLLCTALSAGPAEASSGHFRRLERGALPEVRSPDIKTIDLPNGIRCYLLADPTLPILNLGAIVRAGSVYDPPGRVGLAELVMMLMRSGGAGGRTPEGFDEALADIGARINTSASSEMASASLKVLSGDMQEGMRLFFDMLFEPGFDSRRLSTSRKNLEEAVRREDDSPGRQASNLLAQLVYGRESPWARRPDRRSLSRIRQADVKRFHSDLFKSGNIILTVAGDFSMDEMTGLLKEMTERAPSGEAEIPDVAPVTLSFEKTRREIVRPLSQAFIRMGHLTVKRNDPDRFPLFLVDYILGGGGFTSRLMDEIRVRRGLAYSVFSSISPESDYGLFMVGLNTQAAQAEKAEELAAAQIRRLAVDGDFTREEMDFAKRAMLSRLVFLFDSPFGSVNHMARFHFHGYPENYWMIYRDSIRRVGLADLKRTARLHLKPDGLATVVVGPKSEPAGERGSRRKAGGKEI